MCKQTSSCPFFPPWRALNVSPPPLNSAARLSQGPWCPCYCFARSTRIRAVCPPHRASFCQFSASSLCVCHHGEKPDLMLQRGKGKRHQLSRFGIASKECPAFPPPGFCARIVHAPIGTIDPLFPTKPPFSRVGYTMPFFLNLLPFSCLAIEQRPSPFSASLLPRKCAIPGFPTLAS